MDINMALFNLNHCVNPALATWRGLEVKFLNYCQTIHSNNCCLCNTSTSRTNFPQSRAPPSTNRCPGFQDGYRIGKYPLTEINDLSCRLRCVLSGPTLVLTSLEQKRRFCEKSVSSVKPLRICDTAI
ncbi:hypothetical protein XELAEV_18018523mg [Xenopus laevis]|uniref:Uncharacterized protein n=1 Tax=Xenopus laevis TaxID=8355 RepID=A0A974HU20_XENLA|nr:hypothetical protein XELAEV_18018523mg [Xenopus laevis]